jgi:hypothetical protein
MAVKVRNMTANISTSAKKCYRRILQIHVRWEGLDINSESNVERVFNYLTQAISGIYLQAIALKVTVFSTSTYMSQRLKIIFVATRRSGLSK